MIALSPLTPVQTALYDRLTGDATLAGLVAVVEPGFEGVYDYVPETAPKPYVRLGDHLSIPDNSHTSFGSNITATLHVWTEARGNVPGQAILSRIGALLDRQDRALTALIADQPAPHRVVLIKREFDQALREANPEIRHHVIRFRIKTTQIGE